MTSILFTFFFRGLIVPRTQYAAIRFTSETTSRARFASEFASLSAWSGESHLSTRFADESAVIPAYDDESHTSARFAQEVCACP